MFKFIPKLHDKKYLFFIFFTFFSNFDKITLLLSDNFWKHQIMNKIVLHWLQNPTNFFFLFVWPSPQTDTNKIICFFESISNEIWAFLSVFFFDPLNALKSIMFVEYFYAQHSPGAVQDGVQIPLVPTGYLAIEWSFWTHTFRIVPIYQTSMKVSLEH